MAYTNKKELVFATYYDKNNQKFSTVEGTTAVMVLALEDVDKFIDLVQHKTFKRLAVLSRYEAPEEWTNQFLSALKEYKISSTEHWYEFAPVKRVINTINESTSFSPKEYPSKRKHL